MLVEGRDCLGNSLTIWPKHQGGLGEHKQHAEKEKQQERLLQISSYSLCTASEVFAIIQQTIVNDFHRQIDEELE